MKRIVIFLFLLLANQIFAQNLLTNTSFEECNGDAGCPVGSSIGCPTGSASGFPSSDGDVWHLKDWTNGAHDRLGADKIGSTDWYWDDHYDKLPTLVFDHVNAVEGCHYLGMYGSEGVYYHFNDKLNPGEYKFTIWARPSFATYPADYKWGIALYGDDEAFINDQDNACEFNGDPRLLNSISLTIDPSSEANNPWRKYEIKFRVGDESSEDDLHYFLITGIKNNCLNYYFYIDDVSLVLDCCPDHVLYQGGSSDNFPSVTSVDNYISVGANLGIPHPQPTNVVHIKSGANITFNAGVTINTDPSGFIVDLGGTCIKNIQACDNGSPSLSKSINNVLDFCNPLNDHIILGTQGYTHYDLEIRDSWGPNKIYEVKMAPIVPPTTFLWDGYGNQGIFNGEPAIFSQFMSTVPYSLKLYHCDGVDQFGGNFTLLYACESLRKDADSIVQIDKDLIDFSLLVYPNPTADLVNISYSGATENTWFVLYDILGKEINRMEMASGNGVIQYHCDNLSCGIYLYNVIGGDNKYKRQGKIVIAR